MSRMKPSSNEGFILFMLLDYGLSFRNTPERFDAEGDLTDETAKDFIRQLPKICGLNPTSPTTSMMMRLASRRKG